MRASCCQGISFTPFSNVITFNTFIKFKSKILTKQEDDLLLSYLPKGKESKVTLLYRGSNDGFGIGTFHQKCNGKGATVTIILSDQLNHVFGGFTNAHWRGGNGNFVHDAGAFVYLLRSGKGDNPQKFTIKSGHEQHAIYNSSSYGLTFGKKVKNKKIGLITIFMFKCGGHDLYICNNCNSNTNNSCNPGSYDGPIDNTRLAGANTFKVKEIEVYLVE
ncbi:hypothetical protein RFI_39878 [Reticulomyxa filosa]|uniref:TLDc domain-containing protein n=1 Tax=Reticulomyxa filosa TaxID=46433 RepID=X6L945_RETFI|nr:hypothetical protein RFI_39878 [Reticulomyxa filosa]|eukprot:ETN97651.1 hypothetical protein RFI_39878 [Reticulomyxa filosa]